VLTLAMGCPTAWLTAAEEMDLPHAQRQLNGRPHSVIVSAGVGQVKVPVTSSSSGEYQVLPGWFCSRSSMTSPADCRPDVRMDGKGGRLCRPPRPPSYLVYDPAQHGITGHLRQ
jgi:hypothetical protein